MVMLLFLFLISKQGLDTDRKNKAENLADKFTYRLMKVTYPNTGHDHAYQLTNWSLNDNVYKLKVTAYWYGKCTVLAEEECQTGYDLTINISENGNVYGYSIDDLNDCAKQHALCDIGISFLQEAIESGSNISDNDR